MQINLQKAANIAMLATMSLASVLPTNNGNIIS